MGAQQSSCASSRACHCYAGEIEDYRDAAKADLSDCLQAVETEDSRNYGAMSSLMLAKREPLGETVCSVFEGQCRATRFSAQHSQVTAEFPSDPSRTVPPCKSIEPQKDTNADLISTEECSTSDTDSVAWSFYNGHDGTSSMTSIATSRLSIVVNSDGLSCNSQHKHSQSKDLAVENPDTLKSAFNVTRLTLAHDGVTGTVLRAVRKATGAVRAIKCVPKDIANAKMHAVETRIAVMSSLDHPNLVRLHEKFEDADSLHLVMDCCSGGSLRDHLDCHGQISEVQTAVVMQQILRAVRYMHRKNVCHRDLRPSNVLLFAQGELGFLKVAGFAAACFINKSRKLTKKVGVSSHQAPEMVAGSYGKECDLWSCGVTMFELLFNRLPSEYTTSVRVGVSPRSAPQKLKKQASFAERDSAKVLSGTISSPEIANDVPLSALDRLGAIGMWSLTGASPKVEVSPRSVPRKLNKHASFDEFDTSGTVGLAGRATSKKSALSSSESIVAAKAGVSPRSTPKNLKKQVSLVFMEENENISSSARELVGLFLQADPCARYSASQALHHKWISKAIPKLNTRERLEPSAIDNLKAFRKMNIVKQASMHIIASILSERDLAPSRRLFLSLDEDGDGLLTIPEIEQRISEDPSLAAAYPDVSDILRHAGLADDNRKKAFSYTEFLAATFNREQCLTDDVCRVVFRCFDKNGDGEVSMSELSSGHLLSESSLEVLGTNLEDIDGNGDLHIDFEEFQKMLREGS